MTNQELIKKNSEEIHNLRIRFCLNCSQAYNTHPSDCRCMRASVRIRELQNQNRKLAGL
jgi:hypothetical protein